MSLQVNLSSRDIAQAYQDVVNNTNGINWAIFTYEKGTNDLKVQSTGTDGLEGLEEEFSDGRMQYAFARVTDPNVRSVIFTQDIIESYKLHVERATKVCAGELVWRWCTRIQERSIPYSLGCRGQIFARHARRDPSSQ
jgi:hypothetical protein